MLFRAVAVPAALYAAAPYINVVGGLIVATLAGGLYAALGGLAVGVGVHAFYARKLRGNITKW